MLKRDDIFSDILNTASFSAAAALLFSVGNLFPVLSYWGQALSPLPLAVIGCRRGFARMYTASVFAAVLLMLPLLPGLPMHPMLVMYFLIGYVPPAFAIVFSAKLRIKSDMSLLMCVCVSIAAKVVMMIVFWLLTGRNFMLPDTEQFRMMLDGVYAAQSPDASNASAVRDAVRTMMYLMPYMIPSILMIMSGLESVFCYVLCERMQRGRKGELSLLPLPSHLNWRFSQSLLPALLLSFCLGIIFNADEWMDAAMFSVNLKLLLNILLFIQGMSVIFWWTNKRGFGRGAKTAVFILMLIPLMWVWVILLGVTDMAFDVRSRVA